MESFDICTQLAVWNTCSLHESHVTAIADNFFQFIKFSCVVLFAYFGFKIEMSERVQLKNLYS